MPRRFKRGARIAEQIQREVAEILRLELKDPSVSRLATVTGVDLSSDNAYATVHLTVLADSPAVRETMSGLARAAGFVRAQLAKRMQLRVVPEIRFAFDESVTRGMYLSSLIDEANRPSPQRDEP